MSNAQRPERTREHYIDALARNHVERFILLQGHATDEPRPDYGYDLVVTTFDYNVVDEAAIETFRQYEAKVLEQIGKASHHG